MTPQSNSSCIHIPSCLLKDTAPAVVYSLSCIASPHPSWTVLTRIHTCCYFFHLVPPLIPYPNPATPQVSALFKVKFLRRLGVSLSTSSHSLFQIIYICSELFCLLSVNIAGRSVKISNYYYGFVDFFWFCQYLFHELKLYY